MLPDVLVDVVNVQYYKKSVRWIVDSRQECILILTLGYYIAGDFLRRVFYEHDDV